MFISHSFEGRKERRETERQTMVGGGVKKGEKCEEYKAK